MQVLNLHYTNIYRITNLAYVSFHVILILWKIRENQSQLLFINIDYIRQQKIPAFERNRDFKEAYTFDTIILMYSG
jgi:hypothetical protein